MIATQIYLDSIAQRIERAYKLRHPLWTATGLTDGVWTAAAARLLAVAGDDPALPVDPELYVAVQDYGSFRRDPWCELSQEGALDAYRSSLMRIIKHLKSELRSELRWSKRVLAAGRNLEDVLNSPTSRLSPIGKLMLCHQLDRTDLAEGVRSEAKAQHRGCPLYRFVCKKLLVRFSVASSEGQSATWSDSPNHDLSHIWN